MPVLEQLETLSFRVFKDIAPFFLKRFVDVRATLQRANIKIYPETYISLMLLVAVLTTPISAIAAVLLYFTGFGDGEVRH